MNWFKQNVKRMIEDFHASQLLRALLGGILFAALSTLPLFLLWVNLLFLYVHYLEWLAGAMVVTMGLFGALIASFAYRILRYYNPEARADLNGLMRLEAALLGAIFILIGVALALRHVPDYL